MQICCGIRQPRRRRGPREEGEPGSYELVNLDPEGDDAPEYSEGAATGERASWSQENGVGGQEEPNATPEQPEVDVDAVAQEGNQDRLPEAAPQNM